MKLSNLKTKATALVLTSALCLSSLVVTPNKAEAATDDYVTIVKTDVETASAMETKNYTFNMSNREYTYITITAVQMADTNISVSIANKVEGVDVIGWYDNEDGTYSLFGGFQPTTVGNSTLKLTFDRNLDYILSVYQKKPLLKMNNGDFELTKGFSSPKLSVSNASGKVTWTSSEPSIATVNSSGKVTAKKTGTAIIKATDKSGSSAKCKVTVKANTYSDTKLNKNDVPSGKAMLGVHKISYDKKGNLIIQANFLNNLGRKIIKLKNIKVTVKNSSKKTIGTYTLKSKTVSIPQGSTMNFKFTIKKSKLKIKSIQDLRDSYPITGGQSISIK